MKTMHPKKKQAALYEKFDKLQRKLIPLWEQIGLTAIGDSPEHAENIYQRFILCW